MTRGRLAIDVERQVVFSHGRPQVHENLLDELAKLEGALIQIASIDGDFFE
jgi:hypothetical protein